ncbi:MAG: CehA/McbA family metallohydrolase [Lentisphaeria bacterium]|nr:CehA/McbA family metallohydrolase [Lentisphaeria bacterium]
MRKIVWQKNGGAAEERLVLKANLHTHTTNSDGIFTPAQIIDMYKDAGYDVINFSDHRKVNKVSEYDGRGMTLISGVELHPMGPRGINWHILAIGVPENFANTNPETGQEAVDSVVNVGGIAFCAHPYWCGLLPSEVMQLKNIAGIEVFNSSCRYIGKELNMYAWDICLDAGREYTALAVDDIHNIRDFCGGWTMICAKSNSYEDIIAALKNGDFYATQGPEFTKLVVNNGVLEAEFTSCQYAVISGRKAKGRAIWVNEFVKDGEFEETTGFKIDLNECPKGLLRIQLCDSQGRYCWSNPICNE